MNLFKKLFFKKNNMSCSIGIIGMSNSLKNEQTNLNDDKFLDYAATQIKENYRPFTEIIDYIIKKYGAVPHALSEKQLQLLKANVILNHFREVLDLPIPLRKNPTKKQLIKYVKNDTTFEQAKNYPAEKLGLIMKAYKLPADDDKEIIVKLEITTNYICMDNASRKFADELFLFQGVTQEDIDNKTPRFIAYANTLRDIGKI